MHISKLDDMKAGLRRFRDDLNAGLQKADDAQAQVQANPTRANVARAASVLGDHFVSVFAEAAGVVELFGVRYPVSAYEFRINENLTRGSRIVNPNGYAALVAQGYRSIIDLTLEGTTDAHLAPAAGLASFRIGILDNSAPSIEQMKKFLDLVTNPANQPAYVHCEAGRGRTGVAVACYELAVNHRPLAQVLEEAKRFGMRLDNQVEFVKSFAAELEAGRIEGYTAK
jgi:protein-tyrosine phosphatase